MIKNEASHDFKCTFWDCGDSLGALRIPRMMLSGSLPLSLQGEDSLLHTSEDQHSVPAGR